MAWCRGLPHHGISDRCGMQLHVAVGASRTRENRFSLAVMLSHAAREGRGYLALIVRSRSFVRGAAATRPTCLHGHLGISGGAEAAFLRLASIIFASRLTSTNFRRSAAGREESGPAHIPMMLRVIWTGVRM